MNLSREESKAILALPGALEKLALLLEKQNKISRRLARAHGQSLKTYLTAQDIARRLGYRSAKSVWDMPEVLDERIYPTGTSTPRWTEEGLARAIANMPREPKAVARRGRPRKAAAAVTGGDQSIRQTGPDAVGVHA